MAEYDKPIAPTVENRYATLEAYRRPYLDRAWLCSELTIPSLLPRAGHNSTMDLPVPFQAVGARGVNNLSSKTLLTLFPPNTPFFKLQMDEFVIKEMQNQMGEDESKNLKTEFEEAFSTIERAVMADIEMSADRVGLFEALKHIYVTGNVLLFNAKDGLRVFHLDRYMVRRDPMGNVLEIIVKEEVDPIVLPKPIQEKFKSHPDYSNKKAACLYTYVKRESDHWEVMQEAVGEVIRSTRGTYALDKSPWIPLRFTKIDGEDYGRGYVEEYIGDFSSLENLTAAIVQGSAAAAKVLFLVKPNTTTKVKVLAEAPNGSFRSGNAEDVTVLRLDKQQDFATAKDLLADFEKRLSFAFMLNTAIQREGERVTAEEIRYMAQELEQTLGGFYSILTSELQLPYVRTKMDALQRKGKLPALPKKTVRPTIVTGLEGLGRGHDRNKLVQFLMTIKNAIGEQVAQKYIDYGEAIKRLGTSDGIDMKGLVRSEDQVAASNQQEQLMALVQQLGPNAINALGGAAKERIKINEGPAGQQQASGGQGGVPQGGGVPRSSGPAQ